MPRVSLADYHALGIVISQYVFVPRTYDNTSDYWTVIDDPHVIAATARDLERAAEDCTRGAHRDFACNCVERARSDDRQMLILVQT